MTEERQRIVIAEIRGWISSVPKGKWCHPDNWSMAKNGSYEVWVGLDRLPDYTGDLNEMQEAVSLLTDDQRFVIAIKLREMRLRNDSWACCEEERWSIVAFAKPQELAEAFLRVHNKWEES